ncbi:MAG: hypothetical protein LBD28_00895 [Tannerellaceae bacterium]|nr:hypothetical protein [Tannerellaceae bacterium]
MIAASNSSISTAQLKESQRGTAVLQTARTMVGEDGTGNNPAPPIRFD